MPHTKENEDLQDIHSYDVFSVIGTGSFGTCYKVRHKKTNKYFVWKAVDYGSMSLQNKKLLVTEVNLIGTLKHAHIVQYFGRIIHQSSGTLYIIMEWCERGDLNSLISNCKIKRINICEKFIWKILYQTAKALEACHSLLSHVTVLHRDIKPANIFLDKDYNVKLGDFGLAKILLNNINFSSTVVGTPYYMSPEQIHGSKYNKKTDVWSLGCLIYELCCLNQPFNGNDLLELKENIAKNRLSRIPTIYSDYLDKMVKLLLSSNHEFRPSVEMIIHHPTVICNYEKNASPFMSSSISQNDDEFSFRNLKHRSEKRKKIFADDHIDGIIEKIETLSRKTQQLSLESDPRAITEDVYNRKLMSRLKLLREKESVLKAKEDSLKTKEYLLKTKESSLIHKQKLIEMREREMEVATVRRTSRKSKNERPRHPSASRIEQTKCKKESRRCLDLDSTTCSADPGDTSVYPTAVKLDPSKIIKPSFFKHHLKNLSNSNTVNPIVTYDVNGSGDCTRIIQADGHCQPLSFLPNYIYSHSMKNSKSKVSVKKYQNYLYKK